jgi:hypothetical protein
MGWLHLLRDLDTRPDAIPRARAGTTTKTFLQNALRRTTTQANADVHAAHTLAPDADPDTGGMPNLGAALAAGDISRDHVNMVLRTMKRVPKEVLKQPHLTPFPTAHPSDQTPDDTTDLPSTGKAIDDFFAEHTKNLTSAQTERIAKTLLAALDPDGSDPFDPNAVDRRELTHSTDTNGMVIGHFQFDPVTGELFKTAISHFSAPESTHDAVDEDGNPIKVRDPRTAAQRRADAMAIILRLALAAEEAGTRGGAPPRIVVHTTLDDLDQAQKPSTTETDDAETPPTRGPSEKQSPPGRPSQRRHP